MVINIVTYTAGTFQGTEVTAQMGAVYEFYSAEVKHGQKFEDDDGGIFVYTGVGNTAAQTSRMRRISSRLTSQITHSSSRQRIPFLTWDLTAPRQANR